MQHFCFCINMKKEYDVDNFIYNNQSLITLPIIMLDWQDFFLYKGCVSSVTQIIVNHRYIKLKYTKNVLQNRFSIYLLKIVFRWFAINLNVWKVRQMHYKNVSIVVYELNWIVSSRYTTFLHAASIHLKAINSQRELLPQLDAIFNSQFYK